VADLEGNSLRQRDKESEKTKCKELERETERERKRERERERGGICIFCRIKSFLLKKRFINFLHFGKGRENQGAVCGA
jgi:hypothetical protein